MMTRLRDFFRGIYYEFYKLFSGRYPDTPMPESIEGELLTDTTTTTTTSTSDEIVINPETIRNWAEQQRRLEENLLSQPGMSIQQLEVPLGRQNMLQSTYDNMYGRSRLLSPNILIRNIGPGPAQRDRERLERYQTLHQNGIISDQALLEAVGVTGTLATSEVTDVFVNPLREVFTDPPKEVVSKVNPFTDQERIIDLE